MESMYKILMELPLFKGVSHARMSTIIEKAKFHFFKYLPGEMIIMAGAPCTHIKFVISGAVRSEAVNSSGRFRIAQTIKAPGVIAPDFLFGRITTYPSTVTSLETSGIMQISKKEYVGMLQSDEVLLFNFLNLISMNAQKGGDGILSLTTGSLEERIAYWVVALTQRSSTDITLSCRTKDLYSFFGVQRTSFISTLDSMRQKGLLDYDTHEIRFHDRRKLADFFIRHKE